MQKADIPDLTLFLDIVRTLERIRAPYMIIGGFAATMYGILRTTFDEAFLDVQAKALGPDVEELWQSIKRSAQDEAQRGDTPRF
ncbi:MAG: hypothetical protein V9H69_12355 [Anaerolineae bacterium]